MLSQLVALMWLSRPSPGVTDFNQFQLAGIGRFPNQFPTKAL